MFVTDGSSLAISRLLVLFVMSMVAIEQVSKFAKFVSRVNSCYLGIVEFTVCGRPSAWPEG